MWLRDCLQLPINLSIYVHLCSIYHGLYMFEGEHLKVTYVFWHWLSAIIPNRKPLWSIINLIWLNIIKHILHQTEALAILSVFTNYQTYYQALSSILSSILSNIFLTKMKHCPFFDQHLRTSLAPTFIRSLSAFMVSAAAFQLSSRADGWGRTKRWMVQKTLVD